MKIHWVIALVAITILGGILRFYKLGQVPYGLYQDETAIGYNAYSILKTGKDEHGKQFPLYFKSFGDYKLPLYVYLTVPSVALFGLTEFAVRFPSALFGTLTIPLVYFLIRNLLRSDLSGKGPTFSDSRFTFYDLRFTALLSPLLLAITPWSLHYNRATFEVSISLFLLVAGWLLLHLGLEKQKRGMFFLGTLCFVLCIYSYNLTRLLAPALYVALLITSKVSHSIDNGWRWQIATKRPRPPALRAGDAGGQDPWNKYELVATIIFSLLLLAPFLFSLRNPEGSASASGTLIATSAVVQAPLVEFRSYLTPLPQPIQKLFFNSWFLTAWQYMRNVANYFSVPFFFISGSDHGNHGIGSTGQFYLFELPLIPIGIVAMWKKYRRVAMQLLLWSLVVIATASLTREAPHATRSFFLVFPVTVFAACGFITVINFIKHIRRSATTFTIYHLLFAIYSVLLAISLFFPILYYFADYYYRFPIKYAKMWRSEEKELALFIKEKESEYDRIIVEDKAGVMYSSLLFYQTYPPQKFIDTVSRTPDDEEGFNKVEKFGKYEFRDAKWPEDANIHTMVITSNDANKEHFNLLREFYYPKRPAVFAVKQHLVQYPVYDPAFVAGELKK